MPNFYTSKVDGKKRFAIQWDGGITDSIEKYAADWSNAYRRYEVESGVFMDSGPGYPIYQVRIHAFETTDNVESEVSRTDLSPLDGVLINASGIARIPSGNFTDDGESVEAPVFGLPGTVVI